MGIDEFINNALQGKPAECRIKISEFQGIYNALGEGLKSQGISTSEIVDMRWLNLKAVCPECGGIIFGSELGKLFMIRVDAERVGWDNIFIRGPGRALRFCKEEFCLNESCPSAEIVLFWQPYYDLFKEKKDIEGLIKVLEREKYWFARKKAAEALGNIGSVKAVESLIAALKDENGDVRWKTAVALGEIGDKRAIDSLNELLKHEENDLIREAAKEALEKIKKTMHP